MKAKAIEAGYVPNTCDIMDDIFEDEKEELLWYHSEKLALAFGKPLPS